MGDVTVKKSGTNLYLGLNAQTHDNTYCGQMQTPAPPAQAPLVNVTVACFEVLVQSSNNNGQGTILYVGNQHQGCFHELTPGNSVTIKINDLEKVYVRGSAAGLMVNYAALL